MKTNIEIITEIIEDIENNIGLNWPNKRSKVTKNKLIKLWSEYKYISEYKYFGYSKPESLSRIYSKIFSNIDNEKGKSEPWKSYILRVYNYKYCSNCKSLYSINNFSRDNSTISLYYNMCKQCSNKLCSLYHIKNKEKIHNRHTIYAMTNKDIFTKKSAKRRAAKLQRTPSWLTEEDQWMFKEIYSLAKLREELTGVKWHVDHIIPLQGELVCGLHVPTNLQVITATENLSKSNKYNI